VLRNPHDSIESVIVLEEWSGAFGRGSQRFSLRPVISPEHNFAKIEKVAIASPLRKILRARQLDKFPGPI
jgi:hypothetical protein